MFSYFNVKSVPIAAIQSLVELVPMFITLPQLNVWLQSVTLVAYNIDEAWSSVSIVTLKGKSNAKMFYSSSCSVC